MKRSSSRRTRDRSPIASGFRGRDRAGPVPLRSPSFFTPAVLSLSDSGSFFDESPATVPDDRRLHIPTEPRSGLRQRAKTPAKRFSGGPALVVAPPPEKNAPEPRKGPSQGVSRGSSLFRPSVRPGLRPAWPST